MGLFASKARGSARECHNRAPDTQAGATILACWRIASENGPVSSPLVPQFCDVSETADSMPPMVARRNLDRFLYVRSPTAEDVLVCRIVSPSDTDDFVLIEVYSPVTMRVRQATPQYLVRDPRAAPDTGCDVWVETGSGSTSDLPNHFRWRLASHWEPWR